MSVPMVSIGEIVEKVATWNPARSDMSEFDYIDLSSVDQEAKRISSTSRVASGEAPSRARQLVRKGDVLVSTVRPNLNGVANVLDEHDGMTASTGFCVLRPKARRLEGSYLFHWVTSPAFIRNMVQQATGASYPAVSDRIIKNSEIPLPPLDEQKRIAAILDKADALRRQRRQALALLDSLTQSIFLEMFGDPVSNPKGWKDGVPLSEVAEVGSGITKGRPTRGQQTRSVPYLAVANVQDRELDLTKVKYIEATDAEIDRLRLKRGDLLVTEGGDPDKLGRGTLWNDELPEAIHQNHIFRIRLYSSEITPLFANWLIGSERGKRYFLRSAKQTTGIASINKTQLSKFPLLRPPLELQLDFASRAESVAKWQALMEASRAEADSLFASLQHRAFSGRL